MIVIKGDDIFFDIDFFSLKLHIFNIELYLSNSDLFSNLFLAFNDNEFFSPRQYTASDSCLNRYVYIISSYYLWLYTWAPK